jgi:hypothetical protein
MRVSLEQLLPHSCHRLHRREVNLHTDKHAVKTHRQAGRHTAARASESLPVIILPQHRGESSSQILDVCVLCPPVSPRLQNPPPASQSGQPDRRRLPGQPVQRRHSSHSHNLLLGPRRCRQRSSGTRWPPRAAGMLLCVSVCWCVCARAGERARACMRGSGVAALATLRPCNRIQRSR